MHSQSLNRDRLFCLIIAIFFYIHGCSGKDRAFPAHPNETGSATFSIQWPDTVSLKQHGIPAGVSSITSIDCSSMGITNISAIMVDSSASTLASGSWDCLAHTGRIDNIPTGTNYTIIVRARDEDHIDVYKGMKSGIAIASGQTTNIGTVSLDLIKDPSLTAPVTLDQGDRPRALALDATHVYWVEAYSVNRVSKNGGSSVTLAPSNSTSYAGGIALDSDNVYWASPAEGAIKRVNKDGGSVVILASDRYYPFGIAVDADNVYWTESEGERGGAIKRMSINGGEIATVASGLDGKPYDIAVDANDIYWKDSAAVKKVDVHGGPVTTIATMGGMPFDIEIDATSIYWTLYTGDNGKILKVDKNGGSITTLVYGLSYPYAIAVDSAYVYWSEYVQSETIKKVGIHGGDVTTLAAGVGYATRIAVDSGNLFWTSYYGGAVFKIPID